MRFIVVNSSGDVTEVTSNTPQYVKPRVFVDSIQSGKELPLTPELEAKYNQLVRGHDLHSMDLHVNPYAPLVVQKSSWLAAIEHISFLRFRL